MGGAIDLYLSPPAIEVAYIGTQHPQHKAAVLLCLTAGKAVLCEKPMGVNAAEVREMVAEARSRGLFFMEVRVEGPIITACQASLSAGSQRETFHS